MSATILDSAFPQHERPREWTPPTVDLDSTTDLHDENTSDLAPATEDVLPAPVAPPGADAGSRPAEVPEPVVMKAELTRVPPQVETPARPVRVEQAHTNAAERPDSRIDQARPVPAQEQPLEKTAERTRPAALAPGAVLCDRYLLEEVIGCGGTAVIYRARDMQSSSSTAPNRQIAIKAPRPDVEDRERAAARIRHEFQHASALSHPKIVRVFDLHSDDQHCFMTMELIEGKPLPELLRDWTTLPAPLAHRILTSCAQALSHAHSREVVHGDFKPGNIFVMPDDSAKVVDFGAAVAPFAEGSRIPAGTPAYASPEVLSGQTPDRRDDVFSFACVAYELLAGQHPFERRSSLQAREEGKIPPRAWSLSASQWLALLSALSWQREQRPADVNDVLKALINPQPADPELAGIAGNATIDLPKDDIALAELPTDLMPPQRSWGFFVFVACALAITFIAFQRRNESASPTAHVAMSEAPLGAMSQVSNRISNPVSSPPPTAAGGSPSIGDSSSEGAPPKASEPAAAPVVPAAEAAAAPAAAAPRRASTAPLSEISFESRAIETSESSVAAVFLIKRSQPLRGRVRVQWEALSGTADAGIDFASNASGTVEFADGQAQRAIYVPLRNDLLKEEDETFTVRLQSPQQAKLGAISRIAATIRDDD